MTLEPTRVHARQKTHREPRKNGHRPIGLRIEPRKAGYLYSRTNEPRGSGRRARRRAISGGTILRDVPPFPFGSDSCEQVAQRHYTLMSLHITVTGLKSAQSSEQLNNFICQLASVPVVGAPPISSYAVPCSSLHPPYNFKTFLINNSLASCANV